MAELSDELLMAYADGALDPSDRATVEAAIQQHPEYQQKLEMFRATLKPIQLALEQDLEGGRVVSEMATSLRAAPQAVRTAADPDMAKIVSLASRQVRPRPSVPRTYLPTMIAASIAMLIGGGIGWFLHLGGTPAVQVPGKILGFSDDGLSAQGALRNLLETARGGDSVAIPGADGRSWELKASFTFRATSGSPCRRYEVSNNATRRFAGFACRSMDGQWLVHSHAKLNVKTPEGKGFLPAAADHDAALDAAIRASMSGDVLEGAQEAQLIANHWKSDQK